MNSVVDRCGSLSIKGDSTDEKTPSIDCIVSQSADDEFARLRRQMHWLFHKFNSSSDNCLKHKYSRFEI